MKKLLSLSLFLTGCNLFTPAYNGEPLSISEVLPNPSGTDAGNEYVVIRNSSSATVSVKGYGIRSTNGGQSFSLLLYADSISAGSSLRVRPSVSLAWLNNNGDAVVLLRDGKEIGRVSWSKADDGQVFP